MPTPLETVEQKNFNQVAELQMAIALAQGWVFCTEISEADYIRYCAHQERYNFTTMPLSLINSYDAMAIRPDGYIIMLYASNVEQTFKYFVTDSPYQVTPSWVTDLDKAILLWQEWAKEQPISATTFWQGMTDKTHDQIAWAICERWLAWKGNQHGSEAE